MVHRSLKNSRLICGSNQRLKSIDLSLGSNAGLLYPSRAAKTINELPCEQMPEQLVIIDGTWAQSKTMLRDLPRLRQLPCFQLAPSQPGQYRIRLEPTSTSLSTVEATVQALQAIEPDTPHVDQLLSAFDAMVQRQLDHPRVSCHAYSGGPKSGRTVNVPRQLRGDPGNIIVAYGEAAYRDPTDSDFGAQTKPRPPLFWIAQRLGSEEMFIQAIRPDVEMTASFLRHLELSNAQFSNACSVDEFRNAWRSFVGEKDMLVVYNQGTIDLLCAVEADFIPSTTLKSINFQSTRGPRTLCEFIRSTGLNVIPSLPAHGRAGRRLSNAVALVKHLRSQKTDDKTPPADAT